jgi:hypothetical protein
MDSMMLMPKAKAMQIRLAMLMPKAMLSLMQKETPKVKPKVKPLHSAMLLLKS